MPIEEPNVPHPPRFRWLIRLAVVYAVVCLALFAGWYLAGSYSQRRLTAEVDRLRAAGRPALAGDFNAMPTLPDERNAAVVLLQAANFTLKPAHDRWENDLDWNQRLTDKQLAILHEIPVDYAPQLQLARSARKLHEADWKQTYTSPMLGMPLPNVRSIRGLANLIGYAAIAHHLDGNDAEAVECIRDILHVGEMVHADGPTLIEQLIAMGISAHAAAKVDEVLMELAIDGPPPPRRHASTIPTTRPAPTPRPASRQQVRDLIAELLDEKHTKPSLAIAVHGEQASQLDTIHWLADTKTSPAVLFGYRSSMLGRLSIAAVSPILRNTGVGTSGRMSQRADAAREASYPAALAKAPRDLYYDVSLPRRATRVFQRILEPSMHRAYLTYFRYLAERRAAAIKLAIRLYQIDNGDKLPRTLDELTPKYLPAIPGDPFSRDGRPLRYKPSMMVDETETPVVYSVGENGKDDGGSILFENKSRAFRSFWDVEYDREDNVYPLRRPTPADPPPPDPADLEVESLETQNE